MAQTVEVYIIIVDDEDEKSESEEELAAEKFNHENIRVIYNDISLGGGEARNIGIRNAKSKFIAFLDCDDYWDPNKIESQQIMFSKLPANRANVIFSSIRVVDEDLNIIKEYRDSSEIINFSEYVFLQGGLIQTSSLFLETSLALKNQFNPTLKRHQDYDFCLKLEGHGAIFKCCDATYSYWVVPKNILLIALKKGYDYNLSLDFYNNYKGLMTTRAGYAFLAKVPLWFSIKQKNMKGFVFSLLEKCGFKVSCMVFLELARLILTKWITRNVK
ncbi:glycosyltransferase family 2 protein [Enterobacter cloacae complex sp. 289A7]|uniref:glycosyltransferase family 2 protein n=1 Tax=Enterobacter cloacae complex sp. 289A7 TaxID=3395850 RepID=UPI003CF2156B